MDNRVVLKLKFPAKGIRKVFGRTYTKKIGFTFTHFALFQALETLNCSPDEIANYDDETQIKAIAYGAAMWDRMKQSKKIFFTYEDICFAFNKATHEQGKMLGEAWANASYPKWLEESIQEVKEEKTKKK